LPSPSCCQHEDGQARRQLMASEWGGGSVVVRGRESRPHGEGTAKAGVPTWAIMRTTRHKSGASLDGYIRLASRWDSVASAEIGL